MNYKIAQFILTPGQRSQSALEIYVAQPDANKEALAGKLFALIEIESTKAASLKIINFLINTLNYNYYQNEKMILRERVSTIKIEHIFESALAKTNKKLAEFLQTEKIRFNPNLLNITIGVVYNDSLHFANLGKNKALLIYRGKTDDNVKYKLADITEQTNNHEVKKQSNIIKLFSNVISGSLPRGGYFIFASETFAEYLSAKQIISIITTLPPAGAAEQIKNTLSKINAYVPFLGIIIKNTAGLEIPEAKVKEPAVSTGASIENMIVIEEKTEKLLTPSGLINAKTWSSFFNNLTSRIGLNQANKINARAFSLKDKIFTKRKAGWLSFGKIFNFLKNSSAYLISLFIYIFKIITDKKALADFFDKLISKIKNLWLAVKTAGVKLFFWYKNLNKINKILFSGFVICFLVFSASLGWQTIKNKKIEKQAVISNLTATIEQKQNQIDASLLYNNEEGAKKLLDEIREILKQLPQNSQEQKERYNALAAKNQVQIEKISRVIRSDPVELANFINLNANAKPINIILAKDKIYAADTAQKAVYSIDPQSKLITAINLNNQNISRLNFPSLDKNNNIYYLNSNNLKILDAKTEKLSDLEIDYSGDLQKVIDLKQYNNRFYLTDITSSQIYRFSKSGDKLTGASAWINGKEDLTNVVSMAIDGNIYLLKNNGEILKYTKGKRQDFSLSAVEPPLGQASKIIVSPEQDYIYIFEPAAKRLVVFNKTGKSVCQYASDKLASLKDFQIDEKNKKIYFLNGTSVYSIDASHLNK
jgi:hypothetical protein